MNPVSEIRDAFPLEVAEAARRMFLSASYDVAPGDELGYYARAFPAGGHGIPDHDETYMTRFSRQPDITAFRDLIANQIVPLVRAATGREITSGPAYCYKMLPGDHLRLHTDNYAGHTGYVWHLSKDWKWDWGGLMIAIDGETATATLPVFNTLVLIDHGAAIPHCVTQVAPWAKEPRMIVTGILQ